ncbi:MAG TPA: hypothetical protein VM370_07680 [Candidatus Thermoplasmatota archaeon]|nr:hypothetical protein [Candidatus Thermoplasmatota archaeon]
MPAQHFVPGLATAVNASSRAQANALKALALSGDDAGEKEWRDRAAAALVLGAHWAGEAQTPATLAKAAGVQEQAVAKHYAILADRLKSMAPR